MLEAALGAAFLLFDMQLVSAAVGPVRTAMLSDGSMAASLQSTWLLVAIGAGDQQSVADERRERVGRLVFALQVLQKAAGSLLLTAVAIHPTLLALLARFEANGRIALLFAVARSAAR